MVQRPANGFLTPHVFAEVGGGGEHHDPDHLDVVDVVDDDVVSHAVVFHAVAVAQARRAREQRHHVAHPPRQVLHRADQRQVITRRNIFADSQIFLSTLLNIFWLFRGAGYSLSIRPAQTGDSGTYFCLVNGRPEPFSAYQLAVQGNNVQYSTVQYSKVQYSTVQFVYKITCDNGDNASLI